MSDTVEKRDRTDLDLRVAGVYLYLFHGRVDPEPMDDCGEPGPVLGPFPFVHTTYAADMKLGYENEEIQIQDGLAVYSGRGYGDWSIVSALTFESSIELKQRHEPFDPAKAKMPLKGAKVEETTR